MFIVSLIGGLGSQMEIYAFSLALKKHYPNVIIKYDITNAEHNGFELNKLFGLKLPIASNKEIAVLSDYYPRTGRFYHIFKCLYNIRRYVFGRKKSYIMCDDPSAFYPEIFQLSQLDSYYFTGNYGNERYHEGIMNEIFEAFTFPPISPEDHINIQLKEKIQMCNSVSVHVRHGDYIKAGFPILPLDYYKTAASIIRSKVNNPYFLVFSDDLVYVKENFHFLKDYTIVDCNIGDNSYKDMQLMSLCKHNIIANSTFSHWGAYLNRNTDKIVIAPSRHVEFVKHPFDVPGWLLLDC